MTDKSLEAKISDDLAKQSSAQTISYLFKASLPTIITSVATFLYDTISLYFVGQLNDQHLLAAVGFSLSFTSAFGIGVVFGLSAGFGTLGSQAYGAKNYEKFGFLYHKIWVLMIMMWVLIGTLMFNAGNILTALDFQVELVPMINDLVRALVLTMVGHSMFQMMRFYVMVTGHYNVPAVVGVAGNVIHLVLCILFYKSMGFTFYGCCLARSIAEFSTALIMFIYIKVKVPCADAVLPFTKQSLKGFKSFALDVFSHGTTIYIEAIVLVISSVIIGLLKDEIILAAHSATTNFLCVIMMPFYGTGISLNTLMGKAAGQGDVHQSKKLMALGLLVNWTQGAMVIGVIIFCKEQIAQFYSTVPSVQVVMGSMLLIYCVCLPADTGSNTMGAGLRALGKDRYVFKSFIFAYYAVGTVLSFVLGIVLEYGYKGVWAGLLLGYYAMLLLMSVKLCAINWKETMNEVCRKNEQRGSLLDNEVISPSVRQ